MFVLFGCWPFDLLCVKVILWRTLWCFGMDNHSHLLQLIMNSMNVFVQVITLHSFPFFLLFCSCEIILQFANDSWSTQKYVNYSVHDCLTSLSNQAKHKAYCSTMQHRFWPVISLIRTVTRVKRFTMAWIFFKRNICKKNWEL